MKPIGTGLVEIIGENTNERGFFCVKLVSFLNKEADLGTEKYTLLWRKRFDEAKSGNCAYREICPIYAKTIKNRGHQLIFF